MTSDEHKLRRNTDPLPSHLAASAIVPKLTTHELFARDRVAESPGLTARELDRRFKPNGDRVIGKRLLGCEKKGWVRRGKIRRCSISGRLSATWYPNDARQPTLIDDVPAAPTLSESLLF